MIDNKTLEKWSMIKQIFAQETTIDVYERSAFASTGPQLSDSLALLNLVCPVFYTRSQSCLRPM